MKMFLEVVESYMAEITKLTGREYHCFDYYGAPDADRVIVTMGSATDVAEETIDYLNLKVKKLVLLKLDFTDHSLKKNY